MSSTSLKLSAVTTFKGLGEAELAALEARLAPVSVRRGTLLVEEGHSTDALYVVVSGRFAIEVGGNAEPVAEIAAGSTIGEIAFFTGGVRTATARAIRDSVVVALTRADFDEISARSPAIWRNITATLAERLAAETRKSAALRAGGMRKPRARTIALVRAGGAPLPKNFVAGLLASLERPANLLVLSSATINEYIPGGSTDTLDATRTLNELESHAGTLLFIADEDLTPWSEKAIRQADEVLLVANRGNDPVGTPVARNALEEFSFSLAQNARHRLVLVYPERGSVQGTRHWLATRSVVQHHHAAQNSHDDIARLWRFIKGEALGFVACGGGAYCAAHIGLYQALTEKGIGLDYFGGASGGAAMAAAFAQELEAGEIDARVHRMFIQGRAMQRYTLPRYSLIDHVHFDSHLVAEYGQTLIEDLWKPYFAVSMDLADYAAEVHRTGPVWAAIRASAAIPAVLPPYFTGDGHMLVDGSVISNVPIGVMRSLKAGPNIVVTFDAPKGDRFDISYGELPARRELLLKLMNPWKRGTLPNAPSASTVLVRSLMANRDHFERYLEAEDWLLMPPTPQDMGALDWRRHSELVEAAYRYAIEEIGKRALRVGESTAEAPERDSETLPASLALPAREAS